ncbi:hypothetical protein Taro_052422 [Colocasia esculenta]|uniref:Uncharacterized protein n=1 Tax=Colocasia esculenta TaxID=4460 RepID=A0A843XIJ9_COLES|nr:hypothetical protein [Colocasia esculenta]
MPAAGRAYKKRGRSLDAFPMLEVTDQKLSEINKKNRGKQQLISTTGPKSIAKRQQDYVEIDNILASQTYDGSDNNANAKESEILSEVLGKEHPSKPRCYGSFVNSTDVYGPKNKHGRFQYNCPRVQQMEEEFVFMKKKMLEMETHYKSLEEKLSNVMNTRNQQELMRRDHSYVTVYDIVNAEKVVEEWR